MFFCKTNNFKSYFIIKILINLCSITTYIINNPIKINKMKNSFTLKSNIIGIFIILSTSVFAQKGKSEKNKFLENKKYNVQFYEVKATGRGKALPSFVNIKGGKIQCDLMEDKIQLPPVGYKITLDSTYTEDETEMRMVTFEGDFAEDKNEYKWEATVINYDIEGTVVMSKSGVEKKRFEFSGNEKTKK